MPLVSFHTSNTAPRSGRPVLASFFRRWIEPSYSGGSAALGTFTTTPVCSSSVSTSKGVTGFAGSS